MTTTCGDSRSAGEEIKPRSGYAAMEESSVASGRGLVPFRSLTEVQMCRNVNPTAWLDLSSWYIEVEVADTSDATDIEWEVALLRLTAFPSREWEPNEGWWQQVVGSPAESRVAKPRTGSVQEMAAFDPAGQLVLGQTSTRIDWMLRAVPASDAPVKSRLGPVTPILDRFLDLVKGWFQLPDVPAVKRLAFGLILDSPQETRLGAYERMARLLHRWVKIDTRNSTDFTYTINRSRKSQAGADGLRINRLSKWSVISTQVIALGPSGVTVGTPQEYAARVELDINTAPASDLELPAKHLPAILDEFVALALEIAREGDMP